MNNGTTSSTLLLFALSLAPHLCLLTCFIVEIRSRYSIAEQRSVLILFAAALVALWPSFLHAANLSIVPDSVEYAVGAQRMWLFGSYDIPVGLDNHPPRYPFGFSVFMVLPGLVLGGGEELGCGIIFVTLYGALGVASAYLLGARFKSHAAGILAASILLFVPGYAIASQEILSNVPSASLWLIATVFSLPSGRTSESRFSGLAGTGAALLLATACRPLSILLALPFVLFGRLTGTSRGHNCLAVLPALSLAIAYMAYNSARFGSPLRSGYSYWCSVPYDYRSLTFNWNYLGDNIDAFCQSGLPMFCAFALLAWRFGKGSGDMRYVLLSVLSSGIPIAVAHLFHFYSHAILFLQPAALLAPISAVAIVHLVEIRGRKFPASMAWIGLATVVTCVKVFSYSTVQGRTEQITYVNSIRDALAQNSTLISGLNPVFLAATLDTERSIEIIPISRAVEYASKVVTPRRIQHVSPSPNGPYDHRAPGLLAAGAIEPIPRTALEDLNRLTAAIASGTLVYVDTRFSRQSEIARLQTVIVLNEILPGLSRAALP